MSKKKPPTEPIADGGRASNGQFSKGNPGGPGSPYATKLAAWRSTFIACITDADIKAVALKLVAAAKSGEQWAIRELLTRCIGDAVTADLEDRIAQIEAAIAAKEKR